MDNNTLAVESCRLDQESASLRVTSVCSNGSKCGSCAIFDGCCRPQRLTLYEDVIASKCLIRPPYLMKVRRPQDGSQVADQRLLLGSRNVLEIKPQPSLCPRPQNPCRDYTQNACKDYRNASHCRHFAGAGLCAEFLQRSDWRSYWLVNLLVSANGFATLKLSLQLTRIAWPYSMID